MIVNVLYHNMSSSIPNEIIYEILKHTPLEVYLHGKFDDNPQWKQCAERHFRSYIEKCLPDGLVLFKTEPEILRWTRETTMLYTKGVVELLDVTDLKPVIFVKFVFETCTTKNGKYPHAEIAAAFLSHAVEKSAGLNKLIDYMVSFKNGSMFQFDKLFVALFDWMDETIVIQTAIEFVNYTKINCGIAFWDGMDGLVHYRIEQRRCQEPDANILDLVRRVIDTVWPLGDIEGIVDDEIDYEPDNIPAIRETSIHKYLTFVDPFNYYEALNDEEFLEDSWFLPARRKMAAIVQEYKPYYEVASRITGKNMLTEIYPDPEVYLPYASTFHNDREYFNRLFNFCLVPTNTWVSLFDVDDVDLMVRLLTTDEFEEYFMSLVL